MYLFTHLCRTNIVDYPGSQTGKPCRRVVKGCGSGMESLKIQDHDSGCTTDFAATGCLLEVHLSKDARAKSALTSWF